MVSYSCMAQAASPPPSSPKALRLKTAQIYPARVADSVIPSRLLVNLPEIALTEARQSDGAPTRDEGHYWVET